MQSITLRKRIALIGETWQEKLPKQFCWRAHLRRQRRNNIGRRTLAACDEVESVLAISGTKRPAVAPEPDTTTSLPALVEISGNFCGCTMRPAKSALPAKFLRVALIVIGNNPST